MNSRDANRALSSIAFVAQAIGASSIQGSSLFLSHPSFPPIPHNTSPSLSIYFLGHILLEHLLSDLAFLCFWGLKLVPPKALSQLGLRTMKSP